MPRGFSDNLPIESQHPRFAGNPHNRIGGIQLFEFGSIRFIGSGRFAKLVMLDRLGIEFGIVGAGQHQGKFLIELIAVKFCFSRGAIGHVTTATAGVEGVGSM